MTQRPSPSASDFSEPSRSLAGKAGSLLAMLWRDKTALVSALFLLVVAIAAIFGAWLLDPSTLTVNLRGRNLPPFSLDQGWLYVLGADSLGRSILSRIVVGASYTIGIAVASVLVALVVGGALGLVAGYRGGWVSSVILRTADVIMSFPSLLLALIVLYVLGGHVATLIMVLALSRVPIFLRTCRAEVLEIRERLFVTASRVMGASSPRLIWRHILPATLPTLINLATLEFAFVMLAESSLSFLGLGVQSPGVSWGLMVSDGRAHLASAWWLSFWPGVAITLTAICSNVLAGWVQTVNDPAQKWRLEARRNT